MCSFISPTEIIGANLFRKKVHQKLRGEEEMTDDDKVTDLLEKERKKLEVVLFSGDTSPLSYANSRIAIAKYHINCQKILSEWRNNHFKRGCDV
ncbi:MAG: hypothetical protein AMQ22_00014 [Candidatus Methanofastidiosum methylothiophilum]|uniref:Uncharacterized protein n=1 Tax=Candidatus Methanofastidiosum methylothiophilum TaxID=1705564 RepID=A0A150J9K3_9EURY|nr:MAG: hypothetical protein AMQ22_00014 [Candidatus Methanofastidiosum methylthiophilus]